MGRYGAGVDVPQVVEVRVPAEPTQLPVVRAVASTIAMRENFDLDAISDITMAVDELCSELITRATAGAGLVCQFDMTGDKLAVHGFVRSDGAGPHSTTSFGWRVLTALVDSARNWVDGDTLHIEAVKARGLVTPG
jgi:serine/threonine-protein kinase RsbW